MTLFLLALLAQAAAPAPPAAEDPPVALVRTFLAALDRNDGVAESMLAPGAMMGAGDVGGPASVEAMREMNRQFARLCRLQRVARNPRPLDMPGRRIVLVTAGWHCTSEERPGGHDLDVDYLVENGRIGGLYIPTTPPPSASPQESSQ